MNKDVVPIDASSKPELLALTGIRFVAALIVFLFHIQIRWTYVPTKFLVNVLDQGALGMSLFFVLSGFILSYQYSNRADNYRDYLLNRFARIYPVYVVAALLCLPWIGVELIADRQHLVQLVLLVVSNILLVQAWFPTFFSLWNDGGSWSICVEAFCYLLMPFLLKLFSGASGRQLLLIMLGCYGLAVMPGAVIVAFNNPGIFYSLPIYRLPEFSLGICGFLAMPYVLARQKLADWATLTGLVLLVIYLGFYGPKLPGYITHDWLLLPVLTLSIVSLAKSSGWLAQLLSTRLFTYLGQISYCFYSFQVFLLEILISHHAALVASLPVLQHNAVLAVVSLAILLVLSATGYHFVEVPARRWLKRQGHHMLSD